MKAEDVGNGLALFTRWMLEAWALMLLLGAAHSYDPVVPALGFMSCVNLVIAVWVLRR